MAGYQDYQDEYGYQVVIRMNMVGSYQDEYGGQLLG